MSQEMKVTNIRYESGGIFYVKNENDVFYRSGIPVVSIPGYDEEVAVLHEQIKGEDKYKVVNFSSIKEKSPGERLDIPEVDEKVSIAALSAVFSEAMTSKDWIKMS